VAVDRCIGPCAAAAAVVAAAAAAAAPRYLADLKHTLPLGHGAAQMGRKRI
jgi:hypothetical protein